MKLSRQPDLLERNTFQRADFPRIAPMRLVTNCDTRYVDAGGQLFRYLGYDICKCGRGFHSEAELALFARKSQYHGVVGVVVGG